MNYDRFIKPNSIRDKIDKLIKEKKHPISELPNEDTVKDIFIDLEDDKLFNINIVDDLQSSSGREVDEIVYHEMVLDKIDYDTICIESTIPKRARVVENRLIIIKQPKVLTIIPNSERISIRDGVERPEYVYQMFDEEIIRLRDYLGEDLKEVLHDNKNLVTVIMFNSYECREL